MPIPKAVKITKQGVEFVSQVDRCQYLITELTRAALKDVGKLVRRRGLDKMRLLQGLRRGKRPPHALQYWVRRRETDLLVGLKHDTWYGADQELGTRNQPKRGILRSSVFDNIDDIRRIEGQYLSAIEDENRALGLIDEAEEVGDDEQSVSGP